MSHGGRPIIRPTSYGRVLVLCPVGHLVQSIGARDWDGSAIEARCGDPDYMVTCDGAVPEWWVRADATGRRT